jgi:hypothetical protein
MMIAALATSEKATSTVKPILDEDARYTVEKISMEALEGHF